MSIEIINAFVEGRCSMENIERSMDASHNPLMARAELERELSVEAEFKKLFATIPPPKEGLPRVMKALRCAPMPTLSFAQSETMAQIGIPLRAELKHIPEPVGGYSAAIDRLKSKLAATPAPAMNRNTEMDIQPSLDMPAAGTHALKRTRRATTKIIRLPQRSQVRDVLAAGKDLPENPNEI